MTTRTYDPGREAPTLVRWGAIFAGAVVGLAVLLLLSSLWVAIGEGTGVQGVADNLHWLGFISALFALFVAGYVSGWAAGTRGWGPGLFNGLTVWSLILVGTLVIGVPSALQIFDAAAGQIEELAQAPLWATFWSLLGGLLAAIVGGAIGGSAPRPEWLYGPAASHERERLSPPAREHEAATAGTETRSGARADAHSGSRR